MAQRNSKVIILELIISVACLHAAIADRAEDASETDRAEHWLNMMRARLPSSNQSDVQEMLGLKNVGFTVEQEHVTTALRDSLDASLMGKDDRRRRSVVIIDVPENRRRGKYGKICPKTAEEDNVAAWIKDRDGRLSDGSIAEQIATGSYDIGDLKDDMETWWVQTSLGSQQMALSTFVDMYQDAPEQPEAESKSWLDITLAWLGPILDVVSLVAAPELEPFISEITVAVGILSTAVEEFQTEANTAASSADFMQAAINFRGKLPSKETGYLLSVDRFIDNIRDLSPEKQPTALLQAYNRTTRLVESSYQSYRTALNKYYSAFLQNAQIAFAGIKIPNSIYFFNVIGQRDVYHKWSPHIGQINGATVADVVHTTNGKCISPMSPGFDDFGFKVILAAFTGDNYHLLQYDCASVMSGYADWKEFYEGCWIDGDNSWHIGGDCFTDFGEIPAITKASAEDFCTNFIGDSLSAYSFCDFGYPLGSNCQSFQP